MIHRTPCYPNHKTRISSLKTARSASPSSEVSTATISLSKLSSRTPERVGSGDFTALEILAHSVHFPIELVRLYVKQRFQSYREITITRSATDSRIVDAVTPTLAITISPRFLTATLFGTRATTTKTGCSNSRRRSGF